MLSEPELVIAESKLVLYAFPYHSVGVYPYKPFLLLMEFFYLVNYMATDKVVTKIQKKVLFLWLPIINIFTTAQCINLAIWGELGYVALSLVIA